MKHLDLINRIRHNENGNFTLNISDVNEELEELINKQKFIWRNPKYELPDIIYDKDDYKLSEPVLAFIENKDDPTSGLFSIMRLEVYNNDPCWIHWIPGDISEDGTVPYLWAYLDLPEGKNLDDSYKLKV